MFRLGQTATRAARNPRRPSTALGAEPLERRTLPSASAHFIPGELLVGFKTGVSPSEIGTFYRDYGLSEREALDRYARADTSRLKLVSVPTSRTMDIIAVLERDPRVAYAEPNYVTENALTGA